MPSMNVSFGHSVAAFRSSIETISTEVQKAIEKAVDREATKIMQIMERKTRVRTGRLRRNWRLIPKGSGRQRRVNLINRTPYGVYTTTRDTASKGGTYLADELEKQLRLAENRLKITIRKILEDRARKFNVL